MAENKGKKKEETKAAEGGEEAPKQYGKKEKKSKSRWTLELCMKAAKRFATREEFEFGTPSAFKAAVAHGWDAKCCAHMKAAAPKATVHKAPVKIAAKKKPVGRLPKAS